jgi:predicted nucleic acid-binding protein
MLNTIRVVLAATLIALAGAATADRVLAATAIEYGLIAAFIDP